MAKFIYYAAIVGAVSSLVLLFGVAGASDTGASMQWIIPRAVIADVCMIIFAGVAHIAKQRSAMK